MQISVKGNDGITRIISPYGTLSTIEYDTKAELDQARKDLVKLDKSLHGYNG